MAAMSDEASAPDTINGEWMREEFEVIEEFRVVCDMITIGVIIV
jgi:hypothetical protein